MTTVAFIPARMGSKRLPGKNKKLFHGKPLVQWSIDQAKESGLFDKIIVSSDDPDILKIADESGVVPVERHSDLAKDDTDINDVVFDFFAREENHCDKICVLNPTHPLRTVDDIRESHKYLKKKKYMSVISVVWNDILGWVENATNKGHVCTYHIDKRPTTKSRENWFLENGCIYWCRHKVIMATGTFVGDPATVKLYKMPKERSLEIDDEFDWFLCEQAFGWKKC